MYVYICARACSSIRLTFQAKSVGKPSKETFGNVEKPIQINTYILTILVSFTFSNPTDKEGGEKP